MQTATVFDQPEKTAPHLGLFCFLGGFLINALWVESTTHLHPFTVREMLEYINSPDFIALLVKSTVGGFIGLCWATLRHLIIMRINKKRDKQNNG